MFDLAWVQRGEGVPLTVLPGGPGIASIKPYAALRGRLAREGWRVVMVEHRGVGASRSDRHGCRLPQEALWIRWVIADLVAVLNAAGVERAWVYGTSYGAYLAQVFGALHPGRVAGMVLDSPWDRADVDLLARHEARSALLEGRNPSTARAAALLRTALRSGRMSSDLSSRLVIPLYEMGGARAVELAAACALRGRTGVLRWLARLLDRAATERPGLFEFEAVGVIWFRELFSVQPDGKPVDPACAMRGTGERVAFVGEPARLPTAHERFSWPTAVLSGARDLRCPEGAARAIAERVPDGVHLRFGALAHSIIDQQPGAARVVLAALRTRGTDGVRAVAHRLKEMPPALPRKLTGAAVLSVLHTAALPAGGGRGGVRNPLR